MQKSIFFLIPLAEGVTVTGFDIMFKVNGFSSKSHTMYVSIFQGQYFAVCRTSPVLYFLQTAFQIFSTVDVEVRLECFSNGNENVMKVVYSSEFFRIMFQNISTVKQFYYVSVN